ncbi:DUF1491 family protein [Altererythrobacter arenosus]|uniref:DUF1491 family protein n=1 Tax=Altererythrobacter arenosus TaxID=3032592 RepID=A0ABY8FUF6_9SPHN|nr:DUF1491 family protein [Altererythrobacter sp. CAU 1644]WFL78643.1 DUF1491 family protein [Altererythrobacter sp. CAU 1644]
MDARLPAHLEVAGLLRGAESAGGFGMVLHRGEKDAGTILILTMYRGEGLVLFERMPQLDGKRPFIAAKRENAENRQEMDEYLEKRRSQDPDIWVIELDIADAERFIASTAG